MQKNQIPNNGSSLRVVGLLLASIIHRIKQKKKEGDNGHR